MFLAPLIMALAATASSLILHFDVNETIILEDIAGGDTREMCLNKIIAKSAAVIPDSGSDGDSVGDSFTWLDGSPLNDPTPQTISSLSTSFLPPHPSALPYYRVKSLKKIALNFTTHAHGSRFRPIYDQLVSKMNHGTGLPPTLSKDGSTHFILPSFFKTLSTLSKSSQPFNIVIRTFGLDLPDIASSLTAFAKGLHPKFPDFLDEEFEVREDQIFKGRYVKNEGGKLEWRISNESGEFSEEEALHHFQTNRITLVQDDYSHWKSSNYSPQSGKPCWVTKTGDSPKHIFFDDNIWPDPTDSIVAVRVRETEGDAFVPMSGEEIMREEGKSIVKVFGVEACLNDDYFLDKIKLCTGEKEK